MAGADSDSDSDGVEIIEAPWEQAVLQDSDYKDAFNIFSGRKHGSPGLDKMREQERLSLLHSIQYNGI